MARASARISARIDGVLGTIATPDGAREPRAAALVATIVLTGVLGGAGVGAFGLEDSSRVLGPVFSAIKIPLLIAATTLVCIPGLFVLTTLAGLREDWGASLRAILRGQAAMTCILAAVAPITVFLYISGIGYRSAHLWNAGVFTVAALVAQMVMRRAYRPLIAARPRHRILLVAWLGLYAFVGIQSAWMLRPFIGAPGAAPTFIRSEPLGNAYVVVAKLIFNWRPSPGSTPRSPSEYGY
ncbi:MAG: hypothetical protein ACREJO_01405 [Phycisphaerales bacterium]